MEHWQIDTERGKPQYIEKILSHAHFVHHKFHMDWLESEQDFYGENLWTEIPEYGTALMTMMSVTV